LHSSLFVDLQKQAIDYCDLNYILKELEKEEADGEIPDITIKRL
jgi:hypothetical protein